jgi:hypothetical protein
MVFDKDLKRYLFFPLARPWAAFEHLWPRCLGGDWTHAQRRFPAR